jgi:hypothetical protein
VGLQRPGPAAADANRQTDRARPHQAAP